MSYQRDVFTWKVNSVGIYDPSIQKFRANKNKHIINGVSDIIGLFYTGEVGILIAIEVKTKSGKLSSGQSDFLSKVERLGGRSCVARSIKDVKDFIDSLREEFDNGKEEVQEV